MQTDFYDLIQTLRNTGDPFAIATVVRAEKPTSAKAGAKAIVNEDGKLSGWIGGSCAEAYKPLYGRCIAPSWAA